MRTDIRDTKSLRLPKRLLDAGVPLNRIGQLQMLCKAPRIKAVWQRRRVHDGRNHHHSWKRRRTASLCTKAYATEAKRSQLLPSIEEDAAPTTDHRLPARRVM